MVTQTPLRSEADVAAQLSQTESKHALFELTVGGVSVWRILCFEVSVALQNLGLARRAVARREILGSLASAPGQFVSIKPGYRYLGASLSSALRQSGEAGWRDVYFDYLIDHIDGGAKMAYVDASGFEEHTRNAYRKPIFDDTSVLALSAILGRSFRSRGDDAVFAKLSQVLVNEFGLQDFTPQRVRRKYDVFQWRARSYRQVLRRIRPGAVLVPNSGQFALFLAARSLGIPFVEMQHGIFSPDHPDNLRAEALNYDHEALMLPDLLTVYGSYWAQRLGDSALGRLGRIRSVGAPTIEPARALRGRRFKADPDVPVLTLTSQGGATAEHAAAFVETLLNCCDRPFQLNIRLHPGYEADTNVYQAKVSGDRRVELHLGNVKPDTYEAIALSDFHISVSSACHFDALGIGTPTGVLAVPGHELVDDLVKSNEAVLVRSPEALAEIVGKRSWGEVSPATSDRFFQRDHIESMRAVLAECEDRRSGVPS